MRVREITAFHVRIPLRRTIRHASYTRRENDSLIVRCRLDDGTEGWGEALPRPYVTGETIQTTLDQLRTTDLKSQLGSPLGSLSEAIQLCNQIAPATGPDDRRDCFGNSICCAVELSVLDSVARLHELPLSEVTRLVPEAAGIRESRERVCYSAAITSSGPFRQWVSAWKVRLYGFGQCKVKVGVEGVDDEDALRRIRGIVGDRVDLRLDANEAWSCRNLESKLEPLRPFSITAIEQPVPHAEVDGLAKIRERITIPIMLDESLCSLDDAQRAIERGTCDLFNIRLSKCGGFVNSLRLAALAHKAGLGYQLGCQVGETGILSAAGRHFACSVAGLCSLEGSYDRHLVRERLTFEDVTFGRGGFAPALTGSGLGVQIDPQALRRVTLREEHWKIE